MKLALIHVVSALLALSSAMAGEAFFSQDGTTITLVPLVRTGCLERVDVKSGTVKFVDLPKELKDADITALARGAEGELMFLANDVLWYLKDGEPAHKLAGTAPAKNTTGLFIDSAPGSKTLDWIFISGYHSADAQSSEAKFYARKPGEKKFKSIFCRRLGDTLAGVFLPNGRLFFAGDHDLWEGGISLDDDMPDRLGVLVGARIAPLGTFNTDDANGGGMGVDDIQGAGSWLYVHLRGHHMDCIVRTPVPAKTLYSPTQEEFPGVKDQYSAMIAALGKTEVIADDLSDITGFCVTEVAGKPLLFYRGAAEDEGKGRQLLIWDGTGTPRVIGHEALAN